MMEKFNEMGTKLYVKWQLAASDLGDSLKNEKGQSTTEYGLIIVLICGVVGIAGAIFRKEIGVIFEDIMKVIGDMVP